MNTKFVHYPTLFVCMGSVFCISAAHLELADAIRRCWTWAAIIVASGYYGGRLLISHTFIKPLPLDKILKIFCCVGILEIVYASLQLSGMVHSYFCFHSFSGSFENPAVFGMLLSFCLPVSYYYALKSSAKESSFWSLVSSLFFLFIILSDSRTALLSSLFALLIVSYMELMQIKSLFRKKYFLFALIIGVIFLVGVLYVYKPESANGRFLIWSIALGMIADCPFYGWGTGGFVSQYMNRQAEYFILNPDSSFSLLAGEVSHPFNEFILVAVNYGIAVLIGVLVFMGFTLRMILCSMYPQRGLMASIWVVLNVWCCFSYPFAVPFVWLIILLLFYVAYGASVKLHKPKLVSIGILCICIFSFFVVFSCYKKEFYRIHIQEQAESNIDDKVMARYAIMYEDYKDNRLFLYNYGALLHYTGKYEESLKVLKECAVRMADYNVRILMADDFFHLDMPDSAIKEYRYAHAMIPCRYLPLYYEMKLYQESGDEYRAKELAKIILDKANKVKKSPKVRSIKKEAEEILRK